MTALTAALCNGYGRELMIEQVIQFFTRSEQCGAPSAPTARTADIRILGDVAILATPSTTRLRRASGPHPELFELRLRLRPHDPRLRRPARLLLLHRPAPGQSALPLKPSLRERGFDWWVARIRRTSPSMTWSASTTSVASRPTGPSPPRKKPPSTASGSRPPATNSSSA